MPEEATLEHTPTWVVAAICTVIVAISLAVERLLHYLGKFLKHKGQNALFSALQKIKEELMLLGFISLLLTVSQGLISNICVPKMVSSRMLPCKEEAIKPSNAVGNESCPKGGEVPLLSLEALHQLHIFIFVLAVVHVVFCATTMVLGGAKIKRWKHWEVAIQNEIANSRGTETNLMHREHHTMFVQNRAGNFWRRAAVVSWTIAFLKQFYSSVSKSDYRALRAGFIMKHCRSNPKFDFHKYMMRTLEDDFKKVVGISWYLWLFVVIFLLLNVDGWHTYFWLSFLPLILLLIVGAKLEHIITKIAQDAAEGIINERERVQEGPHVRPSDDHFWFGKPGIVLYLIHFILFQNSFEIAFFFWIWTTYGFDSCIMESVPYLIPRLVMGVLIQVLCSYSTLPLYALVTQMGDMFKKSIFDEHTTESLHGWARGIKKKTKMRSQSSSLLGLTSQRKESFSSGLEIQLARMESA
ncbi:MLO-like protein [Rhynchospora pubera]|uniref:MLO-like protein n=1 Tax=Rhynchospora pubera TaxID=906938 RepID=A0AAV8G802_9POAL|nr:MLO-like protein [Rhynchospora pubera]